VQCGQPSNIEGEREAHTIVVAKREEGGRGGK